MYFLVDFENVRSGGLRGVDISKEVIISRFSSVMLHIAVKTDTWRTLKDRAAISIHVN